MDIQKYLERIDATEGVPSFDHLAKLQWKHLQQIPFENLDVIRKVPIYLNLEKIYEKIVERHRGGYCYEVNGLLAWALRTLGYDAHLIAGTVLRPTGEWAKANTHAAILVKLENKPFLVDVGFGGSTPYKPIPLNGTTQTNLNGMYRIQKVNNNEWDLMLKETDVFRTLYRFSTRRMELLDFHEGCVFNQVSPHSTFTHVDICTKATETGKITLRDRTVKSVIHGVHSEISLSSEEDKVKILKEQFKLNIE